MKLAYYPETDSLYVDLIDAPAVDSREVAPGVVVDFAADGSIVGIDLDRASRFGLPDQARPADDGGPIALRLVHA